VDAALLCQHPTSGCASCCGVFNARDRNTDAFWRRMDLRRDLVAAVGWDEVGLAAIRHVIEARERDIVLTEEIPTCPFAGNLEAKSKENAKTRLGCLIHPRRHPEGRDLRDLGVYPREVCDSHRCAPHDWLREQERALLATCEHRGYGEIVADTGLVKALHSELSARAGGALDVATYTQCRDALAPLWDLLCDWPFADPDARRFGAYYLDDNAAERSVADPLSDFSDLKAQHSRALCVLVTARSSRFPSQAHAEQAFVRVSQLLDSVVCAIAELPTLRTPLESQ